VNDRQTRKFSSTRMCNPVQSIPTCCTPRSTIAFSSALHLVALVCRVRRNSSLRALLTRVLTLPVTDLRLTYFSVCMCAEPAEQDQCEGGQVRVPHREPGVPGQEGKPALCGRLVIMIVELERFNKLTGNASGWQLLYCCSSPRSVVVYRRRWPGP
jgi:hypothetical protein